MKTKTLKLLTLPLLFAMCGCSDVESGTFFLCISNKDSNSLSKTYDSFNGHGTYKRTFKEETTISVVTTTKSGNLIVKVSNTNSGEEYCNVTLTEDYSTTIDVSAGDYTMYVEAKDHSGSYSFSWKAKNNA